MDRREPLAGSGYHSPGAARRLCSMPLCGQTEERLESLSSLAELLQQTLSDSRWDMPYLGMQVLIEGLALAAFGGLRDHSQDPLVRQFVHGLTEGPLTDRRRSGGYEVDLLGGEI